jgi:salicylate hydroxylase
MLDSPYLIVGGGIAGLATALGVAKSGRSSHILEKAPVFETAGAGLQLGPNAARALQYLGAWDAVAPTCVSPEEIHIRDGLSGKILQRVILGKIFEKRYGVPYRVAHRADLQNGLLACVRTQPNIMLQTHAEVTDAVIEKTTLTLKSGETLNARAIIGADGVHSTIRKKIQTEVTPRNIGHTIFRCLVPIGRISSNIEANMVTLWLYPGGHIVHYAVSAGKLFNIVVSAESRNASPATAFQNACPPLAELLNAQRHWQAWQAYDFAPNPGWSQNNTVLVGDAAHASLPYLAQGAAMALEDACVLSTNLYQTTNIPLAIKTFAETRFKRTAAVQSLSRRFGKVYHARTGIRLARNAIFQIMPASLFTKNLSWIYAWKHGEK